ncbi:Ascc1 [Gossypium australe]|uniref:Ascc1 n=1 Tax=Gossypium australe TaxID=47621 RepID=A0A5B6UE40_9ROSI|nr:Ascc1 [Gossypium australe]
MGGAKAKSGAMDKENKKKGTLVWRPVCTQDSSLKEPVIKDVTVGLESDCQMQKSNDKVIEVTNAIVNSKALEDDIEDEAMKEKPELSSIKHSLSIQEKSSNCQSVGQSTGLPITEGIVPVLGFCPQSPQRTVSGSQKGMPRWYLQNSGEVLVGASVIRFVKGKAGSTKEKIEKETGVQIILPSSKQNDSIFIEGTSADSVAKASEEIQRVIDEAVKTASFDYSHFVSLPLAIHPELVSKLVGFQNSILGSSDACIDENPDGNSDGDNSEDSAQEQQLGKESDISVELEVAEDEESVKVDVSVRPLDSNAPKETEEPKSSNKSGK